MQTKQKHFVDGTFPLCATLSMHTNNTIKFILVHLIVLSPNNVLLSLLCICVHHNEDTKMLNNQTLETPPFPSTELQVYMYDK